MFTDLLTIYFILCLLGIIFSWSKRNKLQTNIVYYNTNETVNNFDINVDNRKQPEMKLIRCQSCGSSQFDIEDKFLKCKCCGGLTK